MKTKRLGEFVNDFSNIFILILSLLGIAMGIMLTFTDASLFPSNSITTLVLLMLSALIVQTSPLTSSTNGETNYAKNQNLDTRLYELTTSLAQAGNAISAIEREINSRQDLVEKLEKQKVIAEEAIKLSKEQVEAVSALLSEQVAKQSKKDSRSDWIKQIIFFILGVLATIFLTKLGLG